MCRSQLVLHSMRSQLLDSCDIICTHFVCVMANIGLYWQQVARPSYRLQLACARAYFARLASIWPRATLVVDAIVRSFFITRAICRLPGWRESPPRRGDGII